MRAAVPCRSGTPTTPAGIRCETTSTVPAAGTSAARMSIADGVTGLCFAGADEADLIRAMRTLSADDALVGAMGQAAHQRYWENPRTLDRHVSELEAVYEQALRGRI